MARFMAKMEKRHPAGSEHRAGFALMGVLVTVAVIAILAGVLGPMIFRQMMEARVQETRQQMLALEEGLLRYFDDTGQFPSEVEGLAALATDPGIAGWQGPYLTGDRHFPVAEITADGFGETYAYDLNPNTNPAGTTELLLVSGGSDNSIGCGAVNDIWNINDPGNDILVFIDSDVSNREKIIAAQAEMQTLGDAAKKYFQDHAAFPMALADLSSTYQDGGFAGSAFVDPWLGSYVPEVDDTARPPTMTITSWGPNRGDDGGAGDDIVQSVDSVVPGRRSTYHLIRIAQTQVDASAATALSGDWDTDRPNFNLMPAFGSDGWGNPFEVAVSTRTVLSAGPDGDYFTPEDNIPPGVIPDDVFPIQPLEYVEGSGATEGNKCDDVSFQITNTTASSIALTSAVISWSSPAGYFQKVSIGGKKAADRKKPRFNSGETVPFNKTVTLDAGSVTMVELEGFSSKSQGGGGELNMSGAVFTVVFSDGSTVSFTAPVCIGK